MVGQNVLYAPIPYRSTPLLLGRAGTVLSPNICDWWGVSTIETSATIVSSESHYSTYVVFYNTLL